MSKKILVTILLMLAFIFSVSIKCFSGKNSNSIQTDVTLSYIDFESEEFKKNLEVALKTDYGENYQKIVEKNLSASSVLEKVNQYFYSDSYGKIMYPEYIGGLYINKNNDPIIQIKKDNNVTLSEEKASKIRNFSNIAKNNDIEIEYVNHSYNELEKINNKINDSYTNNNINTDNITANYIDVINNRVVVELVDNSLTKQNEFKNNIINSDAIYFTQGGELVEELNPGQMINNNCTLGFRAKLNDGTQGFVTAGHCVQNISIGNQYSTYGTLMKSQNSGSVDAAFIATSQPVTTTLQYGDYIVKYLSTTAYTPIPGMMVGKSGYKTGYSTGTITSTSGTVNQNGQPLFTDLLFANYNSDGGDSGSPVFRITGTSTGTLIAVHKGQYSGQRISSKYSNIANTFGLRVY